MVVELSILKSVRRHGTFTSMLLETVDMYLCIDLIHSLKFTIKEVSICRARVSKLKIKVVQWDLA